MGRKKKDNPHETLNKKTTLIGERYPLWDVKKKTSLMGSKEKNIPHGK